MLDMPCSAVGEKYFTVLLGAWRVEYFTCLFCFLDKAQEVLVPSCFLAAMAFCKAWSIMWEYLC